MSRNDISRRLFLKQAAALSAASVPVLSSTMSLTSCASANDKVNLALIGIGNRGKEIAHELYNTGLCNIVALCDVDMGDRKSTRLNSSH